MIDALISGKLYGQAVERTGKTGKTFVTAKVRTPVSGDVVLFVGVTAFSDTAKAALLALGEGDAVSIAGALTPGVYTDKDGQSHPSANMVADAVLTVYQVKVKKEALGDAGMKHYAILAGADHAR